MKCDTWCKPLLSCGAFVSLLGRHTCYPFTFPETSGCLVGLEIRGVMRSYGSLTYRIQVTDTPPTSTHIPPSPTAAFSPADWEVRRSMWGPFSSQLVCLLMRPNHPFYHCHPFLLTSIPPPLPPSPPAPPSALRPESGSPLSTHSAPLLPHHYHPTGYNYHAAGL